MTDSFSTIFATFQHFFIRFADYINKANTIKMHEKLFDKITILH